MLWVTFVRVAGINRHLLLEGHVVTLPQEAISLWLNIRQATFVGIAGISHHLHQEVHVLIVHIKGICISLKKAAGMSASTAVLSLPLRQVVLAAKARIRSMSIYKIMIRRAYGNY